MPTKDRVMNEKIKSEKAFTDSLLSQSPEQQLQHLESKLKKIDSTAELEEQYQKE